MTLVKPSLRIVLFLAFSITSIVPVVLLGWWVVDSARDNEYAVVQDKHLLVAKNLTLALSRYARDTIAIMQYFADTPLQNHNYADNNLLYSKNITSIRVFDTGGNQLLAIATKDGAIPQPLTDAQLSTLKKHATTLTTVFLSAQADSHGEPRLLIVSPGATLQNYLVAEMMTEYFAQLQREIKFGELGHAAIVDQAGNVLAHPKPEWVSEIKNIAKVSAVKRMMNRETGVEQFYSPAKKADMIAGFSFVEETGWGVMVPQPVAELEIKIENIKKAALGVGLLGILFAMLISWVLADKLALPTRQLATLTRRIMTGELLDETPRVSAYTYEQNELSLAFHKMIDTLQLKNKELLHISQHDSLTGLANRSLLRTHLRQKISQQRPFFLILLNLNDFKDINDHWSHAHGDSLLKYVSERLLEIIRDDGLVSRIGGDEFAIVLNADVSREQAQKITESLSEKLKLIYQVLQDKLRIDFSSGLACYPRDAQNMPDLMQCADLAMNVAKQHKNSNFEWYEAEMRIALNKRIQLTQDLRVGIQQQQFVIHFQPKVDTHNYRIVGFEALVRWLHPTKGLLYPDSFIPLAENTGLIIPLGELIFDLSCQQIYLWQQQKLTTVPVAINLSARQFEDANLANFIEHILQKNHLEPCSVEFEITESILASNSSSVQSTFNRISAIGCHIAIDDFGTGQSSLSRLKDLAVLKIKIDKSFLHDLSNNNKAFGILQSIVGIGRTLGLGTVIEGVETADQLALVQEINCTEVQGFLFSRGLDAESAAQKLREGSISPS